MRFIVSIFFVLVVLASANSLAVAQSITDSVYHIEEVVTYGDYRKYQPGSTFDKITIDDANGSQEASIDKLIAKYAPIYIKSFAGGLATIQVRGTAPDHTSFNFGGINVNSLTLGHSNVSDISSYLFDQIEIQYGSSSTLNGSGSIGGAVYLGQGNSWTNGLKLNLKTLQGSFGEEVYGTKLYFGNNKFESITKIYSYRKENNFPFENYKHKDFIITRQPIIEFQNNTKINNKGLLQEFNYQFSSKEYIKTMLWFEDDWHQVQPTVKSNQDTVNTQTLQNKHIRIWSAYTNVSNNFKYYIGAGYVHDYQLYDSINTDLIITDRFISEASIKYAYQKKMEFKLGSKYKYIVPNVYSYSKEVIPFEQHLDVYLSYFYQPIKELKTTLNLRQMFVTNYEVPFTPSLGAEYLISKKGDQLIKAQMSIAKSYRVATFNDRFWGTQGNPDILPEDGFNIDAGVTYYYCNGRNNTKFHLNGFYMDIDDWIEWRPGSIDWEAKNIQRVISKGIELHWDGHLEYRNTISELSINYTLNSAKKVEVKDTDELTDVQLNYTPLHVGNANYTFSYKKWSGFMNGNFTGTRYTVYQAYNRPQLPAYFLTDIGVSYVANLKNQKAAISFSVNNLFDVSYQNQQYYAMPGRYFQASLSINLKHIKPVI